MARGKAKYPFVGRCSSCGFLALHSTHGGWYEVEPGNRSSGQLNIARTPGFPNEWSEAYPVCIIRRAQLELDYEIIARDAEMELPDAPLGDIIGQRAAAMLHLDRRCPRWFEYEPGFSPQQHVEREHMLQLERDRARLQIQLARLERQAAADSKKIQEDSLRIATALHETAQNTDHFTTRWTKAAFTLAAIGVALVAMAYTFPDAGRQLGDWLVWRLTHLGQ